MTYQSGLLTETLALPSDLVGYEISRMLAELFPDSAILEGSDCDFDLGEFAKKSKCLLDPDESLHHQLSTTYDRDDGLQRTPTNAAYFVRWGGQEYRVLLVTFQRGACLRQHYWIIAKTQDDADRFFSAVCEWNSEIREEVLVYHGYWRKDTDLFTSIQSARFDNLVLEDSLKTEILEDLQRFVAAKPVYEKYKIPWKRGILLVGPPGNGKTHAIKALINHTKLPCLYVKSINDSNGTDHDCLREVFDRARESAPCILVFEDLDSLINDGNRSFFLNELDGFAENSGLITIASTNHPDRLDPAILSRPSRFDRKYHFPLPSLALRADFVRMWSQRLDADLKIDDESLAQIAEQTEGFSFAYLKELLLSALLTWINQPMPGRFGASVLETVAWLREQMQSPSQTEPAPAS